MAAARRRHGAVAAVRGRQRAVESKMNKNRLNACFSRPVTHRLGLVLATDLYAHNTVLYHISKA